MRRFILVMALIVVGCDKTNKSVEGFQADAFQADINEWKIISKEASSTLYVNTKDRKYRGYSVDKENQARIWILLDRHDWTNDVVRNLNEGNRNPIIKSVKSALIIDCKEKYYWVPQQDTYSEQNGEGPPITHHKSPAGMVYLKQEPTKQNELLFNFACEEAPPPSTSTVTYEDTQKRASIQLRRGMSKEQILNAYGKPKDITIVEFAFWVKPFKDDPIDFEMWWYGNGAMFFDAKGLLDCTNMAGTEVAC